METSVHFKDLLVQQFRVRVLEESIPRIQKCLSLISEADVWYRPNEHCNAIGNLILHLCGNARQWILATLAGAADLRQRPSEFEARGAFSKAQLSALLDQLRDELAAFVPTITVDDLLQVRHVQIFDETGVGILVHVIEHFSYHTGQIAYIVKMLQNRDLAFYDDALLG